MVGREEEFKELLTRVPTEKVKKNFLSRRGKKNCGSDVIIVIMPNYR